MFGLVVRDAALLSSESAFYGPSGVMQKSDMQYITPLPGGRSLLGLRGDQSDCRYLRSQLEAVCSEHCLNFDGRPLSCSAMANYCRHIISKHMRTRPLAVEVLVAGWDDKTDAPVLYWLDEIGAMQQVPYAAHGGQFPFIFSVLDRSGTKGDGGPSLKDVSLREGLEIVESCWRVVRKRSGGSLDVSLFETFAVTRNGVERQPRSR